MPKPLPRFLFRLKRLSVQLCICAATGGLVQLAIYYGHWSGADLSSLDRSTFITALSAVATVIALFCSLSIAWILFVSQQAKGERVAAYDLLKSRLLEAQRWLLTQDDSPERDVCLSLVFELDKLDMSDLPQTDRGPEYATYCKALDEGMDSVDGKCREFFLVSIIHFGYIENLLNRIGLVSIKQVVSKVFIDTLAKGFWLVGLAVVTLVASMLWYSETVKPTLVIAAGIISVASVMLLLEVWIDIRRNYDDDLDFIEGEDAAD